MLSESAQKIRDNVWNILETYTDYNKLFDEQKIDFDHSWNKRIDDIYHREAPSTITKLILALHLIDEYKIYLPVDEFEQEIKVMAALVVIDDNANVWNNALSKYNNENVFFYIEQLRTMAWEMSNALNNIRKD